MTTSLYVHVPFCVVKCGYCDFVSYEVDDPDVHDRFLQALDRELDLAGAPRAPSTVFIGGGTPTHLDPLRLERLFEILRAHSDLDGCAEVTMEANPESTTVEKVAVAKRAGVGRISIGAQSFDATRLRFLDRAHDADQTRRAVAAVREAGFDNVSLDLMFGLPGQTTDQWSRDLGAALALEPDHLSCYQLTFEPGTRLHHDWKKGRVTPTRDERLREMFLLTRERLAAAGFEPYEVSNFQGRGGPCLHNDHYWRQGDYVGVGPGAASHAGGWRTTNLKAVEAWARSVERGVRPTGEAETLSRAGQVGEALWLGLRRRDGVDLDAVTARLGIDPRERFARQIARHRDAGHLEVSATSLRLSEAGVLFADAVGAAFLAPDG